MEFDIHRPLISPRVLATAGIAIVAAGLLAACSYSNSHESPSERAAGIASASPINVAEVNVLNQNWQYMPGVNQTSSALEVSPTDFKIVKQDGTGGQANPPVNLYGTRVQTSADFEITTTIADATADASQQFYDKPPLIADEFRVEPASIRLTENGNDLAVQVYNGSQHGDVTRPVPITKHYTVSMEHGVTLKVTKQAGKLLVSANGQQLPDVPSAKIFKSGNVWFGLDSSAGSFKVTQLGMKSLKGASLSIVDTTKNFAVNQTGGLQDLTNKKRTDLPIGAAMNLESLVSNPTYAREALSNFGSLTPENALKMQAVEPQRGNYQFKNMDALIDIAKQQHMIVHGHTLVFGEAVPAWVRALPADQRPAVMLDYINSVLTHYKGTFATMDVVNEPLADYDQFDADNHIYRDTVWNESAPDANKGDYIAQALTAAHQADPDVKLGINEYGLEASGERQNAMLALVKQLKDQGVPLDYIGIQAHVYDAHDDAIDPAQLNDFINKLADLGVKARISEMDVTDDNGTAFQSDQFSKVFGVCLANKNCIGWTTWGVDDSVDAFQDDDTTLQYGQDFLFKNGRPISAVNTIKQLLAQ